MLYFLHNYSPSSVLVDFGFVSVHWYGLLMVLAIVLGFLVVRFLWKKYGLAEKVLFDLGFYIVIWGFVGARVYHVLNEPVYYFHNPLDVFAVWNGGLAIHGAMIAGVMVLWFFVSRNRNLFIDDKKHEGNKIQDARYKKDTKKQNSKYIFRAQDRVFLVSCFLFLADILTPALALGQSIGRWGNYFNQELYGAPTEMAWGIPIDLINRMPAYEMFTYFHPTFLYESIGAFVIFLILFILHLIRLRVCSCGTSYQPKADPPRADWLQVTSYLSPGSIFSLYLILYSVLRIGMEVLRIDDVPIVFGVRFPFLTSIVLAVLGLVLLIVIPLKKGIQKKEF